MSKEHEVFCILLMGMKWGLPCNQLGEMQTKRALESKRLKTMEDVQVEGQHQALLEEMLRTDYK